MIFALGYLYILSTHHGTLYITFGVRALIIFQQCNLLQCQRWEQKGCVTNVMDVLCKTSLREVYFFTTVFCLKQVSSLSHLSWQITELWKSLQYLCSFLSAKRFLRSTSRRALKSLSFFSISERREDLSWLRKSVRSVCMRLRRWLCSRLTWCSSTSFFTRSSSWDCQKSLSFSCSQGK